MVPRDGNGGADRRVLMLSPVQAIPRICKMLLSFLLKLKLYKAHRNNYICNTVQVI